MAGIGNFAQAVAPDPVTVATNLTNNVGDQVVDAALGIAPIAVPFLLALAAIKWGLGKFGLNRKASMKV